MSRTWKPLIITAESYGQRPTGIPVLDDYLDKKMRRWPGAIYHYTSFGALYNILTRKLNPDHPKGRESKHGWLWASHMRYFNDRAEYLYAFRIAYAVLDLVTSHSTDDRSKAAIVEMRQYLAQWAEYAVFIVSFSSNKNRLSQWRGYCPDDSGYALGISVDERTGDALQRNDFSLLPCIYDRGVQKAAVRYLIDQHLRDWQNSGASHFDAYPFLDAFLRIAPMLKHPSFKEEGEWRIASRPSRFADDASAGPIPSFRAGRSMAIPYKPIPLGNGEGLLPLWEVVIGPKRDRDLAKRSLSGFLRSQDWGDIPITVSRIPFRFL